jgi:hypothetical protein
MKRIYIKPMIEELPCEDIALLTGSDTKSYMGDKPIQQGEPDPSDPSRQFGDDFFEDDEY